MELIADGLLIAGAATAALYCWILARRLHALKAMDSGLGGAIAGLSARVEQTKASLADTKASTTDLTRELSALTARAEIAAGRLELLLATVHEGKPDASATDKPSARAKVAARKVVGETDEPDKADTPAAMEEPAEAKAARTKPSPVPDQPPAEKPRTKGLLGLKMRRQPAPEPAPEPVMEARPPAPKLVEMPVSGPAPAGQDTTEIVAALRRIVDRRSL